MWMCCSRSLNHEINRFYDRCLQLIYNDNKSSLDEMLALDGTVSIHYQISQRLRGPLHIDEVKFSPG